MSRNRLSDAQRAEIVALRRRGLTLAEIATRFGVSPSTVHYWAPTAAPPPSPPPPPEPGGRLRPPPAWRCWPAEALVRRRLLARLADLVEDAEAAGFEEIAAILTVARRQLDGGSE